MMTMLWCNADAERRVGRAERVPPSISVLLSYLVGLASLGPPYTLLIAIMCGACHAAEPTAEKPLEYRRYFVPADRPQDWPKRNVPYFPIDREEFERLTKAANSAPRGRTAANATHVTAAVYQAKLAEPDLLRGEVRFDVLHAGDTAALMTLDPFGLPLVEARWADADQATLGVQPSGKLAVEVPRSGTLIIDWTLRGRRDSTGAVVFSLELPPTAVSQLDLDLPESVLPSIAEGVAVTNIQGGKKGRWRFQLGGHGRTSLRLDTMDARSRSRRLALLVEKTTYIFSPGGIDITALLKLDVHREPLRRLEVEFDAPSNIVSVQYAGVELPWSVAPRGKEGRSGIVVDFPEALLGPGRVVTIRALAPLVVGPVFNLPRPRIRDVAWQEGEMSLLVPAPLALDTLLPQGCRQTKASPASVGPPADGIELQLFSADASIAVGVSRRRQMVSLNSGSTVRFAPESVRSEFRGRFESLDGECYLLHADLGPAWQIESITADRGAALANWSVDATARPSVLIVQLDEPITAAQPLELMIVGHRNLPADLHFSSRMLEMLNFHEVVPARRLVALEAPGTQRVVLDGVDRPRIQSRSELGERQRALLPSALSDVIFEADTDRRDWNVAIEPQTPRYSGALWSTAELSGRQLNESYRIHCQPDGASVDEILVAFSQRREGDPRFTADETIGAVIAQRLDAQQQAARGVPQAGEVWSLRLPQAVDRPFEIVAHRTIDFSTQIAPALVSLPEALSQQGLIEVRCQREAAAMESAERLEPVSPAPRAAGDYAAMVAAFRYDPLDELGNTSPAALLVRPSADNDGPAPCTAWRLRLDSHYLPSGKSRHVAVFDLENHAAAECMVHLPPGAELLCAKLEGAAIADRTVDGDFNVMLPARRQFPVLWLEFVTQAPPWSVMPRCEAPWPTIDLPWISGEWVVSTTAPYEPLAWPDDGASWPRRLFGPLGRDRGGRPFDPSRASDWKNLMGAPTPDEVVPAPAAKLLELWGAILSSDRPTGNWGKLLESSATIEPALLELLRVDSQSLSSIDFNPSTPVLTEKPGHEADGSAASRLAQAVAVQNLRCQGLALLIDGEQIILTSRCAALEIAGGDLDNSRSVVFSPRPDQATLPSTASDSTSYLRLSAWQALPKAAWDSKLGSPVWAVADDLSRSYRIAQVGREGASVRLVRRDFVITAAWALAALVVATSVNPGRWRRLFLPCVVASAAMVALWAPPCFMPLAWGAVIGSLVALFWSLNKPANLAKKPEPRSPDASAISRRTASMVGAALLLSYQAAALGDDAATPSAAKKPPEVHRVFVPLDSKNKPLSRYQVPTDFLDELRRRASLAAAEPRGWLIGNAAYQCTLGREKPDSPLGVKDFLIRYDLHLLSAEAAVRIPAIRAQADIVPDSATIDGQPIELRWTDEGDAILCDLAGPGVYQLQFRRAPVIAEATDTRGMSLSVPKVAAATLDVLLPEGASAEIPGMKGELTVLDGGRRLAARLGPIETLAVRWPVHAATTPVAEVEELLWLNVRPGSVVLDVELNVNVTGGALRQIEFEADRRLRLLPGPMPAKERLLPLDAGAADAPQTTQLELERPLAGAFSLRLSFFMTGASGVGSLRLPVFHTVHTRVARRWLAVTVDAGLEYEARDAEQLEALPAADFAAKWGEADAAALRDALVYRLDAAETAWNLATRSREPQTTVKESLSLSFQRAAALVRYDAQLMTTAGFVFQHRLEVPPEMEIERITVQEEGIDRAARWARGEPGIVSVFLNRRITGAQQLTLWGRLPVRANGRANLPGITLDRGSSAATIERAEVLSRTIHLYRQPSVNIVLEDAQGLSPPDESAIEPVNNYLGRLVLSRVADKTFSGTVVVSANDPRITRIEQLMLLRYVNQSWTAEVDYHFHAMEGVVDALHFDLPGNWAAHLEVLSPAASVDLSDQPGKNRKVFAVRPFKPLTGDCQVKLRASLKFAPGEPVTAPDMVALGMPAAQRYWLLPQQVGVEAVNWDVQRLVPARLPEGLPPPAGAESYATYRAVGDHPQAVMSSVKAAVGIARVRLADVRLQSGGQSDWCGAAAFDLEPGGHATCPLELAAGWQLLHVSVGGLTVTPLAQGPGKWEVPLRSDRLPQRLEATFAIDALATPSPSPSGSGEVTAKPNAEVSFRSLSTAVSLPVVSLPGWLPEETLLTVHAPRECDVQIDAARITRGQCDAARIESVTSLTDLPDEIVATTSHDDLSAWYLPWARWLLFCGRQASLLKPPTADAAISIAPPVLHGDWLRIARRLHSDGLLARLADDPPVATQTMEIWQQLHESLPTTHFRWTGTSGPAQVRFSRPWRAWLGRLTDTAWVAFFFVGAMLLRRFTATTDEWRRWSHAIGVGLGLLWWLFCQPSLFGWLIIACSLAAALRSALMPASLGRT